MSEPGNEPAPWPVSPSALVDTQSCPSCFHVLTALTCEQCGLVVSDPRAARLLELGRSIVHLEVERQQVIDEIRLAHRTAPASVLSAAFESEDDSWAFPPPVIHAPAPTAPPSAPALLLTDEPTGAAARGPALIAVSADADVATTDTLTDSAPTPSTPADAAPVGDGIPPRPVVPAPAPTPRRRRLTVPVLLLIVGVSLVGIAAIFFLILAWTVADIRVKSLIIGGVTLTTMVVASLLRRWSLAATAEGIGALGVILLALDGWAVRANDLFSSQSMDAVVYAGIVALAIGALCRVWSVVSRLRGPDLAATLALPIGLGLLVAGLLPLETSAAITVGLLATAVGGLAHALPAPWSAARAGNDSVPERTALMVIGLAALFGGAAATLFLGLESMAVQLVAASGVIVLGVVYALLLRPRAGAEPLPASLALGYAASALAAGFAASLGWQLAMQSDLPVYGQLVAPVLAVATAVALDRWRPGDRALRAARVAAGLVAGASVLALVVTSTMRARQAIGATWTLWETPVLASPPSTRLDVAVFSAIAAALVGVLLFFAPRAQLSPIRHVRPIVAAVVIVAGALGTGIPIVIVGSAIAIAAIALVALARGAEPVGWGSAAGIAALTAFLGGLASPWLWAIGVIVAIAVPIVARTVVRPASTAAVLLALAPVAVGAVAAFVAPSAIGAAFAVEVDVRAGLALVQWVALVTLVCAAWMRLDAPSRTAVAFSSYALYALSLLTFVAPPAAEMSVSTILGEPTLAIVRAAGLLVVFAFVGLLWTRIGAWPALAAAALVAPAAAGAGIAILATVKAADDGGPAFTTMAAAVAVVWLGALLPTRVYAAFGGRDAAAPADDISRAVLADAPTLAAAPDLAGPPARPGMPTLVRRAADLGALATAAMALGWNVPDGILWTIFALVALGFAGAAVTRGWAAPVAEEPDAPHAQPHDAGHTQWPATPYARPHGIPETRAAGSPLAAAPRRLFAWPAFAAATLALWTWLDGAGQFEIEAFVLPPAIGLLVFAAVLVWLRRQTEATLAVVLGLTLGLVVPAIVASVPWLFTAGPADGVDSAARGAVVAIVAAAVAVVLSWTALRRVRMPALAGAAVALAALGIVAVMRAVTDTGGTGWLLLLVGAAYASAFGFVRGSRFRALPRPLATDTAPNAQTVAAAPPPALDAEAMFAAALPPTALAVSALAASQSLDDPLIVTVALALTGALHLLAAALHRLPLGTATRWTAFAAATVAAGTALLMGDIDAIEVLGLPLAAMLLGGATLGMWRRARAGLPWPATERGAWLAGLVVAIAPSVVAEPHDVRTWLVVVAALLAAIGCVVAPMADFRALKAPSAIVLSAGALAMGLRALLDPSIESGEFAALVAGAGVVVVAAAMVWMSETDAASIPSTALAATGAALMLAVVGVESQGELIQASVTAALAGAIGVGGAALLGSRRWAPLGAILAIAGTIAALIAVSRRFAAVAEVTSGTADLEPDLWATAGVGIIVAVGVMALRSTSSRGVALAVSATFSIALALFTAAESLLLGTADPDELRTALTMSALTIVGVVGVIWRERLEIVLAVAAALLAAVFGIVALTVFDVRPIELVTVPPAIGLIVLGVRTLLRNPAARTWPTLGPGLALLTVPSLVYDFTTPSVVDDFGPTTLWRVVGLGIVAVGLVVAGAVWRLQAPLVLGSVVLLVHALAQLWPWISDMYVAVPWWLWLGIGGALLIAIAARYERRMRDLRTAVTAVTSLR